MTRVGMRLIGAVATLALAAPATAQGTSPSIPEPAMVRLIPELLGRAAVMNAGVTPDHSQHFVPGILTLREPDELNRALAWNLASFPLGPTTGDVLLVRGLIGTEKRQNFGSSYTGNAFTLPRRRLGTAVAYQTTTYSTLDGLDLRASDVNFYSVHVPGLPADESTRDLMQETLSLHINRKVVSFVVDYGVSDRLQVGAVIPIVQVALDARVTARILRTATAATPGIHEFDEIDLGNRALYASSTARGVGDIVLRAKYGLFGGTRGSALAAGVDLRLPTGSTDEFIGLGARQVIPSVMWSGEFGKLAPRARVQFVFSEGELTDQLVDGSRATSVSDLQVPNEIGFSAGFDAPAPFLPHTTLVVDIFGRRVKDITAFQSVTTVFPSRGPGPAATAAPFAAENDLRLDGIRDITQILGSVGARFDIGREVSASMTVLFSRGEAGLRPLTMAVFSIARGF